MITAQPEGGTGFEIFADNEVTARILDIISGAKRFVVLVSPYVDRVGHVEQELVRAQKHGVEPLVVVRQDGATAGGDRSARALGWFKEHNIQVQTVPNLHAKFYINEKEGVVTSMNLLRSSWSGSLEVGVSVTDGMHRWLAGYLRDRVRPLSTDAPEASPLKAEKSATKAGARTTGTRPAKARPKRRARPATGRRAGSDKTSSEGVFGALGGLLKAVLGAEGYCIRCRAELEAGQVDAGNALCDKCYRQWARYKNSEYAEKYCTTCGQEWETSYSRPQCDDCNNG